MGFVNFFELFTNFCSCNPSELRNSFDEFLSTGLAMAREMSEEVGQILGDGAFQVFIHGDSVVAAINVKDNPMLEQQIKDFESFATDLLKDELVFSASILLDKNINEILNLNESQLDTVRGQFSLELDSTQADKYTLKKKVIEKIPSGARKRDLIAKLLFLMFSSVRISIQSESQVSLSQASGKYLVDGRKMAEEYINMAKDLYTNNKEMVDSFPFVQAFFDAVDQHGAGVLSVGAYHKHVSEMLCTGRSVDRKQ